MARPRRRHPALAGIDEAALAEFRAGIRRRYTDEQILEQLRASAEQARPLADDARVRGRPGGRHASADGDRALRDVERRQARGGPDAAPVHQPRRAARRSCGGSGRSSVGTPTARDLDANRRRMASKSLIWHTFGSLSAALREAGFDVPVGDEKLERAVAQGSELARRARPAAAGWPTGRRRAGDEPALLSEWQVYRLVDIDAGPWAAFQFLVRERLREEGVTVRPGRLALGRLGGEPGELGEARDRPRAAPARKAAPCSRGRSDRGGIAPRATIRPRSRCSRRPSATSCLRSVSRSAPSTTSSADFVEAKKSSRRARPIQSGRPTPRARWSVRRYALVDPGGRHRARAAPRARARSDVVASMSAKIASESTVISGSARSMPCGAKISSSLTMIPLWMPTTDPCRIGWLFARTVGWPLV